MAVWQWIVLVFLVLLPFALLADFHPDHERLDTRGVPAHRDWRPRATHPVGDDDHH